MKTRLLLTGRHLSLIDKFFIHLVDEYDCVTSSERVNDIVTHLDIFTPNLFLCCLKNEPMEMYNVYGAVGKTLARTHIPFGIIGSEEDRGRFRGNCSLVPDIMIDDTVPLAQLVGHLNSFINNPNRSGTIYIPGPEEARRMAAREAADIHDFANSVLPGSSTDKRGKQKTSDLKEMGALLDEALGIGPGRSKIRESIRRAAAGESPIVEGFDEPRPIVIKRPDPGKRAHILVIDDDPLMLRTIKEHLKDDYDVGTAVSGRVAMRFLETRTTDLILLDYEMPEEDGSVVLQKLRANMNTRNIPVVFLTGIADTEKIKKILANRPQGYLLKPINHDKLINTITEIFYGK